MSSGKINLCGKWRIQPGRTLPAAFDHEIVVPSLVDCAQPRFDWQSEDFFWYYKSFAPVNLLEDEKLLLIMEQVQFGSKVFLNGHFVGEDIACYTRQQFDLTAFTSATKTNELVVQVGKKEQLPAHSAVGNDFEKPTFIPGIWGDIFLEKSGPLYLQWLRIITDIETGTLNLVIEVQNFTTRVLKGDLQIVVKEKNSGQTVVIDRQSIYLTGGCQNIEKALTIGNVRLWSPEDPFLYELECAVHINQRLSHRLKRHFGFRSFEIRGRHFYLNGQKIQLKGSNIAFHRFLSDQQRGLLPWKMDWVKKVLVDIPRAHNMFFFRIHNGHAYNRWYDVADEHGILLQDEWMFWTSTGSESQILQEFTQWIKDNQHHPSIVIWDPLNESEDERITERIVPKLKKLDPTRPWEHKDFFEDHPYIYSLGPVIPPERFGFSRSIEEMRQAQTPIMVNEYLWWWLDEEGRPSDLMTDVIPRWLGRTYTREDLLKHQAYLAGELTEFFRRLDIEAIMPFVYLSASKGATSHWFLGPIEKLTPKPVLKRLKDAFSPLGVSVDLLDRHFVVGDDHILKIHLFNDFKNEFLVEVRCYLKQNEKTLELAQFQKRLKPATHLQQEIKIVWPENILGSAQLICELNQETRKIRVESRKPVILYRPDFWQTFHKEKQKIIVLGADTELRAFLHQIGQDFEEVLSQSSLTNCKLVFVYRQAVQNLSVTEKKLLQNFVLHGGLLILQEPETDVNQSQVLKLFADFTLHIAWRKDPERGGYDSVVFPEQPEHQLFEGLQFADFQIWNGHLGGKIVEQYFVWPSRPAKILVSCNLGLRTPAVFEVFYGRGRILVSRLLLKGRLTKSNKNGAASGRFDPVAAKYLSNLLNLTHTGEEPLATDFWISSVYSSDGQVFDVVNRHLLARWSEKGNDPVKLEIEFFKAIKVRGLTLSQLKCELKVLKIVYTDPKHQKHEILDFSKKNTLDAIEISWPNRMIKKLTMIYQAKNETDDHTIWKITVHSGAVQ